MRRGGKGMQSDNRAQVSLDFLAGISIFLLTLAYLMVQIPAIFAPFQTQSTDFQPVAYRTGMILAEDTGWWGNGTPGQGGINWEDVPDDARRIGLATNKRNPTNFSELMNRGRAGILDENKIKELNSTYHDNATRVRYLLGLDIMRTYWYNISLHYLNSTTADPKYIPNNTHPVLCIGNRIPETAEVEKMERLVTIEGDSEVGYLNIDATNTSNVTLRLPKLDSFTIMLEGFAEKNRTADARLKVSLNNTNTNCSYDPVINESGLLIGGWHSFNKTVIDDLCDSNDVRIDASWCNVSYMWVNRSDWGDCVGDMSMPTAKLVVYIW